MSFAKTLASTKLVVRGHILNWFWRPRTKRREIRRTVIADVTINYFKRYMPKVAALPETKVIKDDANEKIYSVWGWAKKPALVDSCFRSVERNCSQELVVLNEKTLFNYIDLPGVIMDKQRAGNIKPAHFTDIARVELLHNHGGFWLDATGFVSSEIPKIITEQDFFMYMVDNSARFPLTFFQNCFIRGRKGSYLLEAWRLMILEYWLHESSVLEYFQHQLMFKSLIENDPRAAANFAKMPHIDQRPTHSLWGRYKDEPFNQEIFDQLTSKAFFQKTAYKDAVNPIPGSFADAIIKM